MRLKISLFLPLALALAACNNMTGNVIGGEDSSSSDAMMDTSSSEAMMDSSSSDDEQAARVIEMTVDEWTFAPNAIQVAQGENVIVRLTGVKGSHSFAIPDLDINVPIEPGETKDVTIPTDKAGTFAFRCFVPCGEGHKEMTGTLTII